MKGLLSYLNSSIGKKQIMAIAGMGMVLFILGHMSGNMLLYKGHEAFNGYAAYLQSLGPLLWVFRIGIIFLFLIHFYSTLRIFLENYLARPVKYKVSPYSTNRSFMTRTMIFSAILIFGFVIIHLFNFTFAEHYGLTCMIDGKDLGLYGLVVNTFRNPYWAGFYVFIMFTIGAHLSHAIQSVFQTFGLNHPEYTPLIHKLSYVIGAVVALIFSSFPIYFLVIK